MKGSGIGFRAVSEENQEIAEKKHSILFEENGRGLLPVGIESHDDICDGNKGKGTVKVQRTTKCDSWKYCTSVEASVVILKGGEGCGIEVKVTALCTTTFRDMISFVSLNIFPGIEKKDDLSLEFCSEMSLMIDGEEVEIGEQNGEGSFGVVFKGSYRKNCIVVKRLKQIEEQMNEFLSEVETLAKIQSPYCIHLFGRIRSYQGIGMITEYTGF